MRIEREGWVNTETMVVDAQRMEELVTGAFSHVVSNMVYHTVSDSEAALKGKQVDLIPSPYLYSFFPYCPLVYTDWGIPTLSTESIRILAPGGTLAYTTFQALNGGAYPPPSIRAAFASFPPNLLPANYDRNFLFPAQTTPWGKWSDMDWNRDTLQARFLLEDVHVDVMAHT